ncbi:MAG: bifunctional folylpolyglutamate synthase/dihydrofolate synthase [Marinilabiliaceae bacterium]|nr:bifunctional folylpolyglutamate synthase/dihydrofolate synthase [Marinilabiliaceae bacterium]
MNYHETINFLFEQLPMYQRTGASAYKNNLDNSLALDKWFNHPHKNFKTIHIAGTNGKGSVSSMLASILQESGYKTGLYTSPHLRDFRERIKINGQMIPEEKVVDFVSENNEIINKIKPSFFEMTVAMAFNYFEKSKVDIAVIETGLGGRLDSTNIITPILSIITNIGFDHLALLGNTLLKIAKEKSGIIKKGVPVVIGQFQENVFDFLFEKALYLNAHLSIADENYKAVVATSCEKYKSVNIFKGSEFYFSGLKLPLLGDYQLKNLQTTMQAVENLQKSGFSISADNISKGIKNVIINTGLEGRWQIISKNPTIICDTGHNEDGIREVVSQLAKIEFQQLHFVFGSVNDKDLTKIFSLLPQHATYYFTKANIPRSLDTKTLQKNASLFGLHGECYESVTEAVAAAKINADKNDLIFIGGSTFVVAEII